MELIRLLYRVWIRGMTWVAAAAEGLSPDQRHILSRFVYHRESLKVTRWALSRAENLYRGHAPIIMYDRLGSSQEEIGGYREKIRQEEEAVGRYRQLCRVVAISAVRLWAVS